MDTRQFPNKFHLGCQLFWGKTFGKKACPSPQISTGRQVQSLHLLVSKTVEWNSTTVGLLQSHGPAIHASICTCIIPFNTTQEKTHSINHTPGHNLSMEITTICYQRKNQLNNGTKIIKNYFRRLLENSYPLIGGGHYSAPNSLL